MNAPQKQDKQSRHIGKGMIIAAWILLLLLLTLFFNDRLEQQRNPNRQMSSTTAGEEIPEVVLQRNRYGHYIANGTINGKPVEFMLDTGATDVSIPVNIADKLGLKRGRQVSYQTANGSINAWQTVADEIRLGPIRLGPVRASINPHVKDDSVLLGMSFLKQLDFKQQGNTLTLKYAQ